MIILELKIQNKQFVYRLMKTVLCILVLGICVSYSQAEITIDGSLGAAGPLLGPNYKITADLGRQSGTNLFHSFGKFNLNSSESATFTNQGSIGQINNILSRVTGGKSFIDGVLRSTIPDANLYFINPAGIMFGKNARLDVQGSFYGTSADYLRLGDGTHFRAIPSAQDAILAAALPEAFGFLSENPASISVNGSQFSVPSSETLSLISNDLIIRNGDFVAPEGKINLVSINSAGEINLNNTNSTGESALVRGDITISKNSLLDISGDEAGSIYMDGKVIEFSSSEIKAETGSMSGKPIEIKAESLRLIGASTIRTQTNGQGNAGAVKVTAPQIKIDPGSQITSSTFSKGNAGNMEIKVSNLHIDGSGASGISGITSIANSGSTGNAGTVEITGIDKLKADKISVINDSSNGSNFLVDLAGIGSLTLLSLKGNANTTTIHAKNIELSGGGAISSGTFSSGGNAGEVFVSADNIRISGQGFVPSAIDSSSVNLPFLPTSSGDAGFVHITAQNLIIENGGAVSSSTFGKGDAGELKINVSDLISITGEKLSNDVTGISASSEPGSTGKAGNISIETDRLIIDGNGSNDFAGIASLVYSTAKGDAGETRIIATKNIILLNGGAISSSTFSEGNAGKVFVNTGHLLIDGISSVFPLGSKTAIPSGIGSSAEQSSTGDAGNTLVIADNIDLSNGGVISSRSLGTGQIGDLTVKANDILIDSGGAISANSLSLSENSGAVNPGKIEIEIGNSLRLRNRGNISVETTKVNAGDISIDVKKANTNLSSIIQLSGNSQITTSVAKGKGNGGNINIGKSHKPLFLVLDGNSKIVANAKEGRGGNIDISTGFFFGSTGNITASSEKGIVGTVDIDSPDTDISSKLLTLPDNFFDAKAVLGKPCTQKSGADVIRLVVRKYHVLPQSPYALWDHVPETMLDDQTNNSEAGDITNSIFAGLQKLDMDCLGNE